MKIKLRIENENEINYGWKFECDRWFHEFPDRLLSIQKSTRFQILKGDVKTKTKTITDIF
jgi:hypothetical protein